MAHLTAKLGCVFRNSAAMRSDVRSMRETVAFQDAREMHRRIHRPTVRMAMHTKS